MPLVAAPLNISVSNNPYNIKITKDLESFNEFKFEHIK
jgi:hypothetical protein